MIKLNSSSQKDKTGLKKRNRRFIPQRSYLQLINNMIKNIYAAPALNDIMYNIINIVYENIGGANLSIYFIYNDAIYYQDENENRLILNEISDNLALKAFEKKHTIINIQDEILEADSDFCVQKKWICVFPLKTGHDISGVFKIDGLTYYSLELKASLEIFFDFAALALKNGFDKTSFQNLTIQKNDPFISAPAQNNQKQETISFETKGKESKNIFELWRIIENLQNELSKYKLAKISFEFREELFRNFIEKIKDVCWIKNRNTNKIEYVNYAYEEVWGKSRFSFYHDASSFFESIHPDDKAQLLIAFKEKAAGKPTFMRYRIIRPDGEIRWIFAKTIPIIDSDGQIQREAGIAVDFTEQKIIEDAIRVSESRFRSLADNVPELIWRAGSDKKFSYFNKTWLVVSGKQLTNLLGNKWLLLIHPEDRDKYWTIYSSSFDSATQFQTEFRFLRADGNYRWILSTGVPLFAKDGSVNGFIGSGIDITERKNAEEELKKSEAWLSIILSTVRDGFWDYNAKTGKFLNSPNWVNNLGYPKNSSYSSDDIREKVHPDDLTIYDSVFKKALNGSLSTVECEFRIMTRFGRYIWVRYEGKVAEWDKDGTPIRFIGTNLDITEKKQKDIRIRNLKSAVDQSPASILITDIKGNLVYVNDTFISVTGYQSDEVLGKTPRLFKSGKTSDSKYQTLWNTISSGNIWHGEFLNKKKSGELYWESASISPIKDEQGDITNYLAVKEDITEKKRNDLNLKKALEKAEEANKLKSSLLANMSHEFRTPMNGIIGSADILRNDLQDNSLAVMANHILTSSNRLVNTFNSILSFSELESGSIFFKIQQLHANEQTEQIVNQFIAQAKEKNIELNFSPAKNDFYILADDNLYRQIISNLLDNAIKFTSKGSINIEVKYANEQAVIIVKDTGIGIEKKSFKIIFEEFRQVSEGLSRSYEGCGLGLSIARRMARLMDGEIELKSEAGIGSEFTLTLKAEIKDESVAKSASTNSPAKKTNTSSEPKSILLVEDNVLNQTITKMYLKKAYNVDPVSNGLDAIQYASQKKYDAILMDINLGSGMDGLQATKEIRRIHEYESTPIVAVTGYTATSDKAKFLEEGCSHYLSKPFSKGDLLTLLQEIFVRDK
jgi:PAS domain S-box-containing protein